MMMMLGINLFFLGFFKNYGKVMLLGEEQGGAVGESARKREGKGRR